jgi:hypothetical protein
MLSSSTLELLLLVLFLKGQSLVVVHRRTVESRLRGFGSDFGIERRVVVAVAVAVAVVVVVVVVVAIVHAAPAALCIETRWT